MYYYKVHLMQERLFYIERPSQFTKQTADFVNLFTYLILYRVRDESHTWNLILEVMSRNNILNQVKLDFSSIGICIWLLFNKWSFPKKVGKCRETQKLSNISKVQQKIKKSDFKNPFVSSLMTQFTLKICQLFFFNIFKSVCRQPVDTATYLIIIY